MAGVIVGGLIAFLLLGLILACSSGVIFKATAVEAGVAEYYLDTNHNRQFRWLTNRTGLKGVGDE